MITIANAIYDAVFKFLMEDERTACIMLSALLQRKVVRVEMRGHEYSDTSNKKLSIYRVDFAAYVLGDDGKESLVLVELQKQWLYSEVLRFRRYLGVQYMDKRNISTSPDGHDFGIPCVAIYILGHELDDMPEPIVYVRRGVYNQDNEPLRAGSVSCKFIDSLSHDVVVVQIPRLSGKVRTRLERLMCVFEASDAHSIEIDDSLTMQDSELKSVVTRLQVALSNPDIRRDMQIEEEMISELVNKEERIEHQQEIIHQQKKALQQKDEALQQKDVVLQQKDEALQQMDAMLRICVQSMLQGGSSPTDIANKLGLKVEDVLRIGHNGEQ